MSDCKKCWDTPCSCGWEYRNWSKEARIEQASIVLGIPKNILERLIDDIPEKHPLKKEASGDRLD